MIEGNISYDSYLDHSCILGTLSTVFFRIIFDCNQLWLKSQKNQNQWLNEKIWFFYFYNQLRMGTIQCEKSFFILILIYINYLFNLISQYRRAPFQYSCIDLDGSTRKFIWFIIWTSYFFYYALFVKSVEHYFPSVIRSDFDFD